MQREFADVLAELLSTEGEARALLRAARFPNHHIPTFSTAATFWPQVVDDACKGSIENVHALVLAALERYPHNNGLQGISKKWGLGIEGELELYIERARSLHQKLHIVRLGSQSRVEVELADVYVARNVLIDERCRGGSMHCSAQHATDVGPHHRPRPTIDALREKAWAAGNRGAILLGDPGSGTTTELEHVLLQALQPAGLERLGLPQGTIPVFLSLRHLRDRARGLPGLIQQEFHEPLLDMSEDFGQRLCKRGRVLFLLDGLDQVDGATERAEVARWIEHSRRLARDSYFLVSCRYAGYKGAVALDPGFLELHLQPFDDAAVKDFVVRRYEAGIDPRSPAARKAAARARSAFEQLSRSWLAGSARIANMMNNPLLLSTICSVHGEHGTLSTTHPVIYDRIIEVLVRRWQARSPRALPTSDAIEVLESLAWRMHQESERVTIDSSVLREHLEQIKSLHAITLDGATLLRELDEQAGVLIAPNPGQRRYLDRGLQEHLAAQWLRKQESIPPILPLAQRFDDPWWREVSLMVASPPATSSFEHLMREVVQQPGFVHWAKSETMQECLRRSPGVPASFIALLTTRHTNLFSDVEARQLAVLRLMDRWWPGELDALERHLDDHPSERVRARWRELAARRGHWLDTVRSPCGSVELVRVQGGSFLMGSPPTKGDFDEHPHHQVTLESFYLARTPVTNAQYQEYLEANPHAPRPRFWGNDHFHHPAQPVVGVSWYDAVAFCEWAGLMLPTEAQWEYACRAGTTTQYWSGDTEADLARVGWYFANSNNALQPVGQRAPTAYGLYDIHGNVWEWCRDAYGSYRTPPRAGASDGLRHEPRGDAKRVRKGGGFRSLAPFARSTIRASWSPEARMDDLGFRAARAIEHHEREATIDGRDP